METITVTLFLFVLFSALHNIIASSCVSNDGDDNDV